MKRQSTVAIVKIENGDVAAGVANMLSLIGGLDTVIAPLDTVLIKPNLAVDKPYTSGAVTHPEVLRSCVNAALAAGAKKVIVADSSVIGTSTQAVMELNGLYGLASKRVEIVDFKKSLYREVVIPNATKYRRLSFPEELFQCDTVINIPVMKTHDILPVTLGLKNMKGLMPDRIKRRIHSIGVEEAIIDINRVALADFTLIDGVIAMEGNGPLDGEPVGMNLLIGSQDALAVEVTAIRAMGFEPSAMEYLQSAFEAGFGELAVENIRYVGEPLEAVRRPFRRSEETRITPKWLSISDAHACSSCRNRINMLIAKNPALEKSTGNIPIKIYAGDQGNLQADTSEGCLRFGMGNCLLSSKDQFDRYIPGCPPTKSALQKSFTAALANREKGDL